MARELKELDLNTSVGLSESQRNNWRNLRKAAVGGADFARTESRWVDLLLKHVQFSGIVHEPFCGTRGISERLIENGVKVKESDIIRRVKHKRGGGFTQQDFFDINACETSVAIIRRYNEIWKPNPPNLILMPNRPMVIARHDKKGKKSAEFQSGWPHVWIVWDRQKKAKKTEFRWDEHCIDREEVKDLVV